MTDDARAPALRIPGFDRARRELLANLVARELKSRYKGSALGFLWTVLTPLFMAAVYVFFLRLLVGKGVSLEGIIIGVFGWQYTVQSVNSGLVCVTGNSNLVKKVFFPRWLLPVSATTANLIGYLLSLIVQFAVVGWLLARGDGHLSPWVVAVPAVIALQTVFNLALALLLASANVYFRDTQHLLGVAVSAWFFVSPVMYDVSFVEQFSGGRSWLMPLYLLNPVAAQLSAYRTLILDAPWPSGPWIWAGLLWPAALLAGAWAVFRRAQRNFSDWL